MVDPAGDKDTRVIGPGVGGLLEDLGEDDHLNRPLEVLDGGHQHGRAGPSDDAT